MNALILKISFYCFAFIYLILSLFGIYHQILNDTLFVLSFIVFTVLITQKMFTKGPLHLIKYVFSRFTSHLNKNHQKQDDLVDHYEKVSKIKTASNFWIFASLTLYIETLLIGVFLSK